MTAKKHYRNYPEDVLYSDEYMDHISAMTREELHSKSDIALELAYRDLIIKGVRAEKKELEEAKITCQMKADCIGEFHFDQEVPCGKCLVEGINENCDVCDGELSHEMSFTVPWDLMKEIYKAMHKSRLKAVQNE